MIAERLTGVVTHHGEGAGWHELEGVFKVVDVFAGDLVTMNDDGTLAREHVGEVAAAWCPRAERGQVVAVERGFAALGGDEWELEVWSDPRVRMNDGACDPQGRFYCGSTTYDTDPGSGVLWRLDPDLTVHRVLEGLTIPNGLVWSLDGFTVFHVDTPTGKVDAYAFDPVAGSLQDRRTVLQVIGGDPDGMTIDAEGGLWIALWGGGAVHRYEPSGELTEVVHVDAQQVTSCAFGGPELDRLVITTSRHGLGEVGGAGGSIFAVDPGVRGVPAHAFAG